MNFNQFNNFAPKLINDSEKILLTIDKQIPTYFLIIMMPFITIFTVFWLYVFKLYDVTTLIFILLWLIEAYCFINSFFVKCIITDQNIFYRNVLNLSYRIIPICNIKSVSAVVDHKYGECLDILQTESFKKISLRVIKRSHEARDILERLIMSPEELTILKQKRISQKEKEKITPLQWAFIMILLILVSIIRLVIL